MYIKKGEKLPKCFEKKKRKVTPVSTVDLLMFLSSLLWQEGMFDSWLLPHNITVLYASACPHCSWFSLCWWLNKIMEKKKNGKKSGILPCHHLTCHRISSSHHSWVPQQCCQIPGCLWLCYNTNLPDFKAMLPPPLLTVHLCSNPTLLHSFLTSRWYISSKHRYNSPSCTVSFSGILAPPTFPLSALTLQTPNPLIYFSQALLCICVFWIWSPFRGPNNPSNTQAVVRMPLLSAIACLTFCSVRFPW